MSSIYAIILAGGQGLRLGTGIPKQFLMLGGKPVIQWSIEAFSGINKINEIIIVIPEVYKNEMHDILQSTGFHKNISITPGGNTRQLSAYNAINSRDFMDDDILIFHDAARPFINGDLIIRCIEKTEEYGATGVYVKAIDTIAERENSFIKSIPSRDKLLITHTPQCFKYNIIRDAHEKAIKNNITFATDDVKLAIEAGYKVRVVEGDYNNLKITTQFDLEIAEQIALKIS
jgi:2-C-methyl-D-erythritol 4-phosphate cytidylyltransferase